IACRSPFGSSRIRSDRTGRGWNSRSLTPVSETLCTTHRNSPSGCVIFAARISSVTRAAPRLSPCPCSFVRRTAIVALPSLALSIGGVRQSFLGRPLGIFPQRVLLPDDGLRRAEHDLAAQQPG